MARLPRAGIEYFSFAVDFFQDEKIRFVSARFGIKGEMIAIRLLCKIYSQGYYLDWNEDTALLFAKSVGDGCQHSLVNDVVHELLKRGFFNKSIFESFAVLTSRGIQKRYFEATKRRKKVEYDPKLLLIDLSKYRDMPVDAQDVDISFENVYILDENADILQQSKSKDIHDDDKDYLREEIYLRGKVKGDRDDDTHAHKADLGRVMSFYLNDFGTPAEVTRVSLDEYTRNMGCEVVIEALSRAKGEGKGWSYGRKILQNWMTAGVTSMADVIRLDREWEERKPEKSERKQHGKGGIRHDDWDIETTRL